MSKALWACSVCGEDFTRRSSAERHRYDVHQGNSLVVRFVDYLAGRASGIYPEPIDPPRLLRRARPQFGKTPNGHLVNPNDVIVTDNRVNGFCWYPNTNVFLLQLKTLMNQHSNQEIPFFQPPMNISNPLCSTGILPYANISKVRTRFDHFLILL
jgi:hypothetical protein